jgi:hypothetical protein
MLPLKIEIKGKLGNLLGEIITIGFIHDTIKNYFIVEKIKKEFQENENSTLQLKLFT